MTFKLPGASRPAQLNLFAVPAAAEKAAPAQPREPTLRELVKPGTVLETPFARYIVVAIVRSFYAPDRPEHYRDLSYVGARGAKDRLIGCHHFAMAKEAAFLADPRLRSLRGDSYMSRVVAKAGRLATLYDHHDDIVVVGINADAAALLAEGATA